MTSFHQHKKTARDPTAYSGERGEIKPARVKPLVEAGANIVGGRYATTPAHIQAFRKAVDNLR